MLTMLATALLIGAPAKAPGVAVIDLKAVHGIESSLAEVLNEVLLASLKETGYFSSVLGGSDMAAMVDMEQQKASLGCDDTSCLAELGGALGVPYLVSSSLSKVGGQFVFTLKILAVEEAKVAVRKVQMVKDEAALIPTIQEIVPKTVAQLGQAAPKAQVVAAPKAVVPSEPSTAPTAVPQARALSKQPAQSRKFGLVTGLTGFAAAGGGLALLLSVAEEFHEQKSDPNYDLEGARSSQSLAQGLIVGGVSVAGIGAVMAVMAWP